MWRAGSGLACVYDQRCRVGWGRGWWGVLCIAEHLILSLGCLDALVFPPSPVFTKGLCLKPSVRPSESKKQAAHLAASEQVGGLPALPAL